MTQEEYKPSLDEQINLSEGTIDEVVRTLEHLKPDEFYKKSYPATANTQPMQDYIERLRKAGLDIGKGEARFGFKMPLPEKHAPQRNLIIFRRR